MRPVPSREDWVLHTWPKVLIGTGLAIFWASCIWSPELPAEVFYVGPGMMVAGVALMVINGERG
ncbi:MAG TPA: hypothetical protein VKX45_06520 [Bryobacteraceae bacterium]|nr:hypothetical protein [Bryobacteraceae bacterium]